MVTEGEGGGINREIRIYIYKMCMCACVLSCFSHVQLFATPWTVAHQAPWDSPGKNTGVGYHALLQGIFPTQGPNPSLLCLLHWQVCFLPLALFILSFLPPSQNGASINVHWWVSGLFALPQDCECLKGGLWTQYHAVLFGLTTVSFKLEDTCFKMLYWFLPCNSVNHP